MKLIRKNKNIKDCGVVAAFNASSWCNLYRPYHQIERVARSCGYNPKKGIYFFQFAGLLKKLGVPAKKIKPRSIEDLESKIYLGKFYCFLYTPTGCNVGHVITTFMDHTGSIRVLNPDNERLTWDELASDIYANGMLDFHVYEVPPRKHANDDSRAA